MKHMGLFLNIRKHFFTLYVIEHWQKLPRVVVFILKDIQKLSGQNLVQLALGDPSWAW